MSTNNTQKNNNVNKKLPEKYQTAFAWFLQMSRNSCGHEFKMVRNIIDIQTFHDGLDKKQQDNGYS
jgi:hypothetical protein